MLWSNSASDLKDPEVENTKAVGLERVLTEIHAKSREHGSSPFPSQAAAMPPVLLGTFRDCRRRRGAWASHKRAVNCASDLKDPEVENTKAVRLERVLTEIHADSGEHGSSPFPSPAAPQRLADQAGKANADGLPAVGLVSPGGRRGAAKSASKAAGAP